MQLTDPYLPLTRLSEMDQDTFRVMWEMSAADSPAQHCFLRQPQLEYFVEAKTPEEMCLETMPNVRLCELMAPDRD
jgi:hypothetical protein